MKNLSVEKLYDGKRLTAYLQDTFPTLKQSVIFKALRNKDIRINGLKIKENVILHENDIVTLYIDDRFFVYSPEIIYEDEYILIVNKPVGVEVIGKENSLTTLLRAYTSNPQLSPCHRLDFNTCGLVLFAKTQKAHTILLAKFKNREIKKQYLAKVYGIPKVSCATMEAFLFKDSKKGRVYISDTFKKGYVKIKTSYSIVSTNKETNTAILNIILHTGKTHQIRAHLAHMGFPIIGDEKYGNFEINKRYHCKTQLLQSYKLGFGFTSDSGILSYLTGKEFVISSIF